MAEWLRLPVLRLSVSISTGVDSLTRASQPPVELPRHLILQPLPHLLRTRSPRHADLLNRDRRESPFKVLVLPKTLDNGWCERPLGQESLPSI